MDELEVLVQFPYQLPSEINSLICQAVEVNLLQNK